LFKRGQRCIIIELGKYNESGELLIGIDTTGSLRHICYWDTGPEGIGNYGCCLHGEEGVRGMNMKGCIQLVSELGMIAGMSAMAMELSRLGFPT